MIEALIFRSVDQIYHLSVRILGGGGVVLDPSKRPMLIFSFLARVELLASSCHRPDVGGDWNVLRFPTISPITLQ